MGTRQPETVLVDKIRKAIRADHPGAWVFKAAGGFYQSAGVPDLLVIVDGQAFGLEVKCPQPGETAQHARGRATLRQQYQLQQIRQAGASAGVVTSPAEALALIAGRLGPG